MTNPPLGLSILFRPLADGSFVMTDSFGRGSTIVQSEDLAAHLHGVWTAHEAWQAAWLARQAELEPEDVAPDIDTSGIDLGGITL